MPHQQRGVMQQQLQMLQEYMLPMLSNLSMGITMPGATVDVISNTAPVSKTGMSGLSCTVCAMIMPDLPTLEQHLRIHEEEKPYKCLQCGQRYKYQSAYQRHIDMNHTARLPQEKPYRCEVCGQFFKYLKSFHKHRANHTAIDRILNTTSDDSATTSAAEFPGTRAPMPGMMPQLPHQMAARPCLSTETMDSVLRGSAPPDPRPYGNKSLDVDEEEEPNSVTITAIKQERTEVPPLAQSQQELQEPTNQGATSSAAGQSATEAGNGGQSESLPQPESPDPPTDDCSADFIGDDTALGEAGGSGSAKSWICPYCLKGFRGKENLKLHIRTHTGEKPYECGSCDKRFVGKSDLNRHLRIHTGEKPYECNICFRRFARGDYLSKHVVTHSQSGSPQPPGDIGGSTDSTVSEEQTATTDQPSQP